MFFRIDKQKHNPLVMAYESGDIDEFRYLIESGHNVNCLEKYGASLIATVIVNTRKIKNNIEFFDELIKSDVYLYKIGNEPNLLNLAIVHQEDTYYMKKLLQANIDMNLKNTEENGALMVYQPSLFVAIKWAISHKTSFEKLDILLKHNPDISMPNIQGNTLINYAIYDGSFLKIFPTLLKNNVNLNQSDRDGVSPLHLLSKLNSDHIDRSWVIDAMNLLLDNNADPNIIDDEGTTPFIACCFFGNIKAAKVLIKHSADINIQDDKKMTAAMHAAEKCNFKILQLLEENKANFTIVDNMGNNVGMHMAMQIKNQSKNTEIYNFLYQHADLLTAKNQNGICALDIIQKKNTFEYTKLVKIIKLMEKNKKTDIVENIV